MKLVPASPLIISRTRRTGQGFIFANIPKGVTLQRDWAALDQSRTFALVETDELSAIEEAQEPLRPYVDIEIVPVREIIRWEAT